MKTLSIHQPAVHANPNTCVLENLDEGIAGELSSLVRIEDLRGGMVAQGLLQGTHTELGVQGIGEPPGEHLAAVQVENGHKVQEPPGHGNIGYVRSPDLVGPIDGQILEQIRINLVSLARFAGPTPWVQGRNTHQVHKTSNLLAVDLAHLSVELIPDPPVSVKGKLQVDLIDPSHQL